jgi:hypothetical protein
MFTGIGVDDVFRTDRRRLTPALRQWIIARCRAGYRNLNRADPLSG